nr:hypothetical protein [Tanacetum cinerariifolium]
MSSFYEFTCYGCGGPSDTPLCYLCTCEQYGNILIDGTCLKCNSGAGNSFIYDPNPKTFNEVQSIFNPPLQSHYNIYLCQICESNYHYSYECSQRVPLVYEPKPCYNQNFGDNDYLHDSSGVTPHINHHCCYKCGDSLNGFFCHQCTYSLRIKDEHLDTIRKTKWDKFIKFSVENLAPSPSESKDLFDSECDVPVFDDFTTFSNLLFDADDDFSYNDEKSFSNEDIPKKIYSNPLFDEEIISIKIDLHHFNTESDLIESLLNQDSLIISSSKINCLLDEFFGELILLKLIPQGIDEADCDPEEEIRLIEKLLYDNSSPPPIPFEDSDSLRDETDLSLTPDDSMPPGIEDDDYEFEGDILILEELLSNDSLLLPENESFLFDIPSSPRPPGKPLDNDEIKPISGMLNVKVVGDISEHYVPLPRLLPTQPTHVSNQEKYPHLLSHQGLKAFYLFSKSPMMIYEGNIPNLDVPFLHFYPH